MGPTCPHECRVCQEGKPAHVNRKQSLFSCSATQWQPMTRYIPANGIAKLYPFPPAKSLKTLETVKAKPQVSRRHPQQLQSPVSVLCFCF